jgi:hypothetical protein
MGSPKTTPHSTSHKGLTRDGSCEHDHQMGFRTRRLQARSTDLVLPPPPTLPDAAPDAARPRASLTTTYTVDHCGCSPTTATSTGHLKGNYITQNLRDDDGQTSTCSTTGSCTDNARSFDINDPDLHRPLGRVHHQQPST